MSIRKFAVSDTAVLHLLDATGAPMYAGQDEDGEPALPIELILYSPGSKEYSAAEKARTDAVTRAVRPVKGKVKPMQPEEAEAIRVEFLAACTAGSNNLEMDGLQGAALYRTLYADRSLGFVIDQVDRFLGDWGNFSTASATD